MIERPGVQPVDHQRRRQIVVEQRQIVRRRLQPAIEAAQIVDRREARFRHPPVDEAPGVTQFRVIVLARADIRAVGRGKARRMGIAEAVLGHIPFLVNFRLSRRYYSQKVGHIKYSRGPDGANSEPRDRRLNGVYGKK